MWWPAYTYLSKVNYILIQKTFSAFIPPAVCLCMLHFVGCHRYLVVVLLCATLGINGFNFSAVTCNQLDIAPKFAGTLMGITNSVGNIMGFLAPQISGAILNGHVSLYSKHFQFRYDECIYHTLKGDSFCRKIEHIGKLSFLQLLALMWLVVCCFVWWVAVMNSPGVELKVTKGLPQIIESSIHSNKKD